MYIITGATGHVGRVVAERLLARGKQVGVIGRSRERLAPLLQQGAQPHIGALDDRAFLARALSGAEAVFVLLPPNPQAPDFRAFQNRIGAALAGAVQAAGVPRVVNLSSQGAQLPAGTGPIAGLHDQEQRLNQLPGVHVVHLRPAFFMENFLFNLDLIRRQGLNGTPLRADLAIPMIATRDIALAAVEHLAALTFTGRTVHDLLGPRDLSMSAATSLLGRAIGQPELPYVQFPYEDARKAMLAMGLSADMARQYIEMYQAFNEGRLSQGVVRTPANTTPTPFEEFAREFAGVYAAAPAGA